MLKTFDKLSNDYFARIDAREWFKYYKNKLKRYDTRRIQKRSRTSGKSIS